MDCSHALGIPGLATGITLYLYSGRIRGFLTKKARIPERWCPKSVLLSALEAVRFLNQSAPTRSGRDMALSMATTPIPNTQNTPATARLLRMAYR